MLAGARWLQTREPFLLALAGLALAVALQIKTEALVEVAALVVVGALFARRLLWLGLALLAALPWLAWRWLHDVPSRAELDLTRVERVPDAARAVAEHLFDPTEWLVLVPLAILLAADRAKAEGAARRRERCSRSSSSRTGSTATRSATCSRRPRTA